MQISDASITQSFNVVTFVVEPTDLQDVPLTAAGILDLSDTHPETVSMVSPGANIQLVGKWSEELHYDIF